MQKRENGKIPRAAFYQSFWAVKDMERMQRLAKLKVKPGQPGELVFYADEESRTMRAEVVEDSIWKLKCIRDAINTIPEEYREEIIESIHNGEIPAEIAHENTWKKWKRRFIKELAHNLNLI